VRDFLQRVRSRRFPPIESDMRMVLAHCGPLLLDPAALQEVGGLGALVQEAFPVDGQVEEDSPLLQPAPALPQWTCPC
jgi:hypothetical protein